MKDLVPLLDLSLPVFQAPLPCYPEQVSLAIQASNHGALGTIDVCTLAPKNEAHTASRESTNDSRESTRESISNALSDLISDVKLRGSNRVGLVYDMRFEHADDERHHELNHGHNYRLRLEEFLSIVSNDPVKVVMFRHGLPDNDTLRQLKRVGITVLAIASNVLEAIACDAANIDAIVLQGMEAAGIHSRFDNDLEAHALPAQTLLQQSRPLVTKPLILWGDITTSASVVAALVSGAQAVMVDTPLWTCTDSPLPQGYLTEITTANEVNTVFDNAFLGVSCRSLPINENAHNAGDDYVARLMALRASWHDDVTTAPIFSGISCASSDLNMHGLLNAWKSDLDAILGQGVTHSEGAIDP